MSRILLKNKLPKDYNPELVWTRGELNFGLHGKSEEFKKWLFHHIRPYLRKGQLSEECPQELKIYYEYYLTRVVPNHTDLGRHKLDDRIYIKKFYPWCYRNYLPTLVLQGWFSRKQARLYYRERFGPNAIKSLRFISGGRALARGFEIGCSLSINGRWIPIVNKIPYASAMEDKKLLVKGLHKYHKRTVEGRINKRLKYYSYGRNASERMLHYKQVGKEAENRKSKIQETFERQSRIFDEY